MQIISGKCHLSGENHFWDRRRHMVELASMELKVIEGRQSTLYNHFKEYELASCRATTSRLMGVVALKITWYKPGDASSRYHQIMHLDYSEYGIDEYQEFECIPGRDDYAVSKETSRTLWNNFINVIGDAPVNISTACMLRLIESALPLAEKGREREYDSEENIAFRRYALRRIGLMKEALAERSITSDGCSSLEAIETVSAKNLGQYATINYFLMRLADADFEAAAYLSDMSEEELRSSMLAQHGVQTLMRNSITRLPKKDNPRAREKLRMYSCRLTTLAGNGYYYTTLNIWLDGGRTSRDATVMDLDIGSMTHMSAYESALQIVQPEYITVFACHDNMLDGFDAKQISPLSRAEQTPCANGWTYTIYNQTNTHVEKSEYRLGEDVYGYALLTIGGELILMSHDLSHITMLDDAAVFSIYSPYLSIKGRYRLDNPIFHTLCHTPGVIFDDLVEPEE